MSQKQTAYCWPKANNKTLVDINNQKGRERIINFPLLENQIPNNKQQIQVECQKRTEIVQHKKQALSHLFIAF